jgi:hypothetical protein
MLADGQCGRRLPGGTNQGGTGQPFCELANAPKSVGCRFFAIEVGENRRYRAFVWLAVERHLERHGVGRDGYLLHAHHGGEVLDSNCRVEFKAVVRKAGHGDESWTAHTLRHFFASSAIAGGVSLLEVSRWLGHATIQITADIYGRLTPDAGGRPRPVMDQVLTGASVVGTDNEDGAGSVLGPRAE